jgi:hypothetical protein
VAKFDKVIPPGQEGKIQLVVEGAKVHGEFNKSASVETNDPDHPHLTISITGKEIAFVNVTPEGTVYLHGPTARRSRRTSPSRPTRRVWISRSRE